MSMIGEGEGEDRWYVVSLERWSFKRQLSSPGVQHCVANLLPPIWNGIWIFADGCPASAAISRVHATLEALHPARSVLHANYNVSAAEIERGRYFI